MPEPIDRLLSQWTSQWLIHARGNDDKTLAAFESQYSAALPKDLRRYLSIVDGFDDDSNGFNFWPLRQIKPAAEVCSGMNIPLIPEGQDFKDHFIFADYLQWCWAYAIDLSGRDPESQPVVHVGTLKPKTVAGSFTEFVELYLKDDARLYILTSD